MDENDECKTRAKNGLLPLVLNRMGLSVAWVSVTLITLFYLNSIFYVSPARTDNSYLNTKVGDQGRKHANFKIPSEYQPDVHDGFFRLVVDYPSLRPTVGPRRPPISTDALDIVVLGYPKNGTLSDDIVNGTYGSQFAGRQDGYMVYTHPLGKSPPRALVFQDAEGNYVAVEMLGSWSVRNEIMHGVAPHYLIRFSVGKNMNIDFKTVDGAVSKLVAGMYVGDSN